MCFVLRIISAWSTVCREKKNRLISALWLVVGRLVNKQINTTRWSRLYFISSFRSVQLSIYFWATGVNRQYKKDRIAAPNEETASENIILNINWKCKIPKKVIIQYGHTHQTRLLVITEINIASRREQNAVHVT